MITNKELAGWLRTMIRVYEGYAININFTPTFRIRCYGVAKGFQLTLALIDGAAEDIKPLIIGGKEVC